MTLSAARGRVQYVTALRRHARGVPRALPQASKAPYPRGSRQPSCCTALQYFAVAPEPGLRALEGGRNNPRFRRRLLSSRASLLCNEPHYRCRPGALILVRFIADSLLAIRVVQASETGSANDGRGPHQ